MKKTVSIFLAIAVIVASCSRGSDVKPRIVTTTDVFEDGYPAEKAIDRLARLGYEGIDMGLDYWTFEGSPFREDNYLEWGQSLRARADEKGIPYTHAHAPGVAADDYWMERSIEMAAVLGARDACLIWFFCCLMASGNRRSSNTNERTKIEIR